MVSENRIVGRSRMSSNHHDDDTAKHAILDRWVKVFDKSLASPVPQTLILERSNTIKLEDVQEVVSEEIDIGVSRVFKPPTPPINIPRPSHTCPRHGREGRRPLDERLVKPVKAVLPKSLKPASGKPAILLKKDDGSLKSTNVPKIPPEPQITIPSRDAAHEARKDPPNVRFIDYHVSEAAPAGYSSKSGQSSSIERMVPDNCRAKEPVKPVVPGGEPITLETAKALRVLLFGSRYSSFSTDWRKQHINFFKNKSYALSFFKPGPDGIMACLQGFLLRHLLFEQPSIELVKSMLTPMSSDRQKSLVGAIVQILWQAGEQKQATVVLPCGECNWVTTVKDYREDTLTETLRLYKFNNYVDLERFMKKQMVFFESSSGNGCILLLYSVILSRTISRVMEDLSEPDSTLMGPHDSCSQAMINLLLTGRASQNVFNGDIECTKSGRLLAFPLKGVKNRSEVGFLSIDEHNDAAGVFSVDSMLKTPKFPVWVVNTGEHYGVLFALNKELVNDWRLERRFDLFFCAGSAKRNHTTDECVFTVDTRDVFKPDDGVDDEPSNVEHCIRTKWPGAVIERKEVKN